MGQDPGQPDYVPKAVESLFQKLVWKTPIRDYSPFILKQCLQLKIIISSDYKHVSILIQ